MMEERTAWLLRAPLLAALGAVTGLCFNLLIDTGQFRWTDNAARIALATFLLAAAIMFGLVVERRRLAWAASFAVTCGVVTGLVSWWTGVPSGVPGTEPWHLACASLAIAIAAPLFQAARDEEARRFPYPAVHRHAWTNVVLWFASWAFVLVVWLLAWLLASLFNLIGIDALQKLLDKGWFDCLMTGAALGGAIGLLRERDRIVATLQKVVTAVFGVLAPVLAVGLLAFLILLPFRGIGLLWDATKHTTPILISCVACALILANSVLSDAGEDEPRSPILRWGAMGLGLAMLPLALIAAVSTAKRIHQYGLTPDRLWAVTFVMIATAYALAYLVALVRGRSRWGEYVRPANLRLAFGVCGVALLLATPLAAFGALSAHDQLARIRDGRAAPDKIDYSALAFDMGKAGRHALETLRDSGASGDIRKFAREGLAAKTRWQVDEPNSHARPEALTVKTQVLPVGAVVPPRLWDAIPGYNSCSQADRRRRCVIRFWDDRGLAVVLSDNCPGDACGVETLVLYRHADGSWGKERIETVDSETLVASGASDMAKIKAETERTWTAVRRGEVDIRPITRDRLFIVGEPTDQVIDPPVPTTPPAKP